MAELVQNRSQRLHFDVSSPNGILLFRVTSQMIVAYGMKVKLDAQVMVFHSGSVLFPMQHYHDEGWQTSDSSDLDFSVASQSIANFRNEAGGRNIVIVIDKTANQITDA